MLLRIVIVWNDNSTTEFSNVSKHAWRGQSLSLKSESVPGYRAVINCQNTRRILIYKQEPQ